MSLQQNVLSKTYHTIIIKSTKHIRRSQVTQSSQAVIYNREGRSNNRAIIETTPLEKNSKEKKNIEHILQAYPLKFMPIIPLFDIMQKGWDHQNTTL